MKRYAVLGLVCFSLSTCMFKSYNQSYEMTIQLVDMDEKPIKDLKVRIR